MIQRWLRRRAEREAYLWRCETCGRQLNERRESRIVGGTLYNWGICPKPHYITSIPGVTA